MAHMPETVDLADVPAAELIDERERWVLKRAIGRVGDQVSSGTLTSQAYWKGLVDELTALRRRLRPAPPARARGVDRPAAGATAAIPTPFGDRFVTLGAYVLDGRFVGYFARITAASHVSHDALCIPVFVGEDGADPSVAPSEAGVAA